MPNNIKVERARANKTQQELAKDLMVDASTVSRWESGETEIPSSMALRMAHLFGCTTDYILGASEKRTAN